jgi:hypothetical protein
MHLAGAVGFVVGAVVIFSVGFFFPISLGER